VDPSPATKGWAARQPLRTQAGNPPREADWVNVSLVGGRTAIERAFTNAGWTTAERTSVRADVRVFLAVAEHEGYQRGPVSLLTLDGASPALVFQKQTNTFAKRHHVRLWPARGASPEGEAWIGAATHDIGLEFSHTTKNYTHRIDGNVDDERRSLLTDLVTTGSALRFGFVARPDVPQNSLNATGDAVTTDGRLAIVWLRTPSP
jgi:hypothetical protein